MLSRFFIDRPIGAWVVFFVIIIMGGVALTRLPISQYPEVAPPTIQVTTVYPGADARTVAATVATPIEQEINGVEGMLYMSSQCTNDGQMNLTVTFDLGTDLDMAQVLVQNRVAVALPKIPEEVRRQGVVTKKRSPSILLVINLISPDDRYDQLYLSNYVTLQVKDAIARVPGVGDTNVLGARDYSMRVWLDPDQMASRNLSAGDVLRALREQNVQVAAGRLGQPPTAPGNDFQLTLSARGRLIEEDEFDEIIVKTGENGEVTRLRDVGRTELGAKNYEIATYLDGKPAVSLAVFQLPGSNAVATARLVRAEIDRLAGRFPPGVAYRIVYDTTVFVEESIYDVAKTLFEAFVLVVIVVLVFLQDWRATILPMLEVPVSLIGTFFVMALMGFSLNNLSLFGLVLAIGIVVDDAIVVIENVERWMATGLNARDATIKAMDEVTAPVLAIAFVLAAVFIPVAFMAGISGQFYRQFALTIAVSTLISAVNALTMTPARCVIIFGGARGEGHGHTKEALPRWGAAGLVGLLAARVFWPVAGTRVEALLTSVPGGEGHGTDYRAWAAWGLLFLAGSAAGLVVARPIQRVVNALLRGFNRAFELLTAGYGRVVAGAIRVSAITLLVYGGLIGLTVLGFRTVPAGFIPDQDKGYLVVNAQLPDGASLERTEAVMARITGIVAEIEGVAHTIGLPGYSVLTGSNLSNAGGMFVTLDPFEERAGKPALGAPAILAQIRGKLSAIQEAQVGRLRRAAGRGDRQHRRLQDAGAGPGRHGLPGPPGGRGERHRPGQRPARPDRPLQHLPGQPAPAGDRHQPHAGQGRGRRPGRRLPHAPDLPRFQLCQRLHPLRPELAGERAGRLRLPGPQGGHRPAPGAELPGPDGPPQRPDQRPRGERPGDRQPLQPVPVGRDQRQRRPRGGHRPGHRPDGGDRRRGAAPDDGLGVDRADLPADRGRQGPVHQAGLAPERADGLPRAGLPVRELGPAAGGDPDRAAGPALGDLGRALPWHG